LFAVCRAIVPPLHEKEAAKIIIIITENIILSNDKSFFKLKKVNIGTAATTSGVVPLLQPPLSL
jgi:hypothetical protein